MSDSVINITVGAADTKIVTSHDLVITHESPATTTSAGSMSATDKVKSDRRIDLQADLGYPRLVRADGTSDAAWYAAVAALPDVTPYLQAAEALFGPAYADSNNKAMRSGAIYLPEGAYRSKTEWQMVHPIELYGDIGSRDRTPAKIFPARGVTPIRLCYGVDNPVGGGSAAESTIRDLAIVQLSQDLASVWSTGAKTTGQIVSRVTADPLKTVLFVALNNGNSGGSEPTWNETEEGHTTDGAVTWLTRIVCGVRAQVNCKLRNVMVNGVQGNAFHLVASVGGTPKGNANTLEIHRCYAVGAYGHGFYAQGSDANAGKISGCTTLGNRGVGFYEASQIGNLWEACDSAGNLLDDFRANIGVFNHCYTEDGGTNTMQRPALVIGGTLASYCKNYPERGNAPFLRAGSDALEVNVLRTATTDDGTNKVKAGLGELSAATMLYGALDVTATPSHGAEFRVKMGEDGGLGSFVIADVSNASALQAFRVALIGTSWPTGTFFTPQGVVLGPGDNSGTWSGPRFVSRSAAPTTGAWRQGDIAWNSAPTAGSPLGWRCVAAGTPGTWETLTA